MILRNIHMGVLSVEDAYKEQSTEKVNRFSKLIF